MLMTAEQLTKSLGGRWNGRSGCAFCPAHENHRTPALSISVGDQGKLLLHCFSGCEFIDVLNAIAALGHDVPRQADYTALDQNFRSMAFKETRRSAQAEAIWNEAFPIADTPAESYLRNRGISSELPESLRYHPHCWHGPSARRLPALIAKLDGSANTSIHRTYLRSDGTGKALVVPDKMMLGATAGGAVPLGTLGPEDPLVVAEGIETALSLRCGLISDLGTVWAALSANGMMKVSLPRRVSFLGKLPGLTVRLSLILTLLEWARQPQDEPREITGKTFSKATVLVEDYILPMAKRAYGNSSFSAKERAGRCLVELLRKKVWTEFSTREIRRLQPAGLAKQDQIDMGIAALERADIVKAIEGGSTSKGGRPQRRYTVNPAIHR